MQRHNVAIGDNKSYFDQVFTAYIAASYIVFDKNNALPSWKFMSDIHSPAFLFNGAPTLWVSNYIVTTAPLVLLNE